MKPRLLDLFSGAGGAARGYQLAGFHVTGVDLNPQPRYAGDEFLRADALGVLRAPSFLAGFDAIHASPPCQRYSAMSVCRQGLAGKYPALIEPTRGLLSRTGLPWVIENVPRSPLRNPLLLCGQMFGLDLYRHRLFEGGGGLVLPLAMHPPHGMPGSPAGHWAPGTVISVAGHCAPIAEARRAMGIDWMRREELAEAIPPAYSEHVGVQLMATLRGSAAAS